MGRISRKGEILSQDWKSEIIMDNRRGETTEQAEVTEEERGESR